jgi:hypothetical protein
MPLLCCCDKECYGLLVRELGDCDNCDLSIYLQIQYIKESEKKNIFV